MAAAPMAGQAHTNGRWKWWQNPSWIVTLVLAAFSAGGAGATYMLASRASPTAVENSKTITNHSERLAMLEKNDERMEKFLEKLENKLDRALGLRMPVPFAP